MTSSAETLLSDEVTFRGPRWTWIWRGSLSSQLRACVCTHMFMCVHVCTRVRVTDPWACRTLLSNSGPLGSVATPAEHHHRWSPRKRGQMQPLWLFRKLGRPGQVCSAGHRQPGDITGQTGSIKQGRGHRRLRHIRGTRPLEAHVALWPRPPPVSAQGPPRLAAPRRSLLGRTRPPPVTSCALARHTAHAGTCSLAFPAWLGARWL